MNRKTNIWDDIRVSVQESEYVMSDGSVAVHSMFHVVSCGDLFEAQLNRLWQGVSTYLSEKADFEIRFGRCFVSDSTNQEAIFRSNPLSRFNLSFIQQSPLDGSKIALWLYLRKQVSDTPYHEIWTSDMTFPSGNSYEQTEKILTEYETLLDQCGCSITDQCVRTWFFVRDVDTQYKGLVDARMKNFEQVGLTNETHYISSTGICGQPASVPALVQMDAYAVKGLRSEQIRFLYAKSHLNSTYDYGVTFERGTAVDYEDHTEVYISGTASIDNKGDVLYVGDVARQTERMLENVSELLKEGGAQFGDVMQVIVYLRDISDYDTVKPIFMKCFDNDMPIVFTHAPVCRPAWLIEMECIAMTRRN